MCIQYRTNNGDVEGAIKYSKKGRSTQIIRNVLLKRVKTQNLFEIFFITG